MRKCHRTLIIFLNIIILTTLLPRSAVAQNSALIEATLQNMSVDDKVGQLFLITFGGDFVGANSEVAEMIQEYRVGGVVLQESNGNFNNDGNTPLQIALKTNALQTLAFSENPTETSRLNLPLFIAVYHEGDGCPYTSIRNGMTTIPSQMAIGATWEEQNAVKVGEVVGYELSMIGINMLLGPSLDVLDKPRSGARGDLGIRAFGGAPEWVGRLGSAYIRGVHWGSKGKVLTVSKHFPGQGSSDRSANEEIANVEKSLSELRQVELVPFTKVVQGKDSYEVTDALMTSHVRYRGLQGEIQQLTNPISFDVVGMNTLFSESEFAEWRAQGGLLVSYSLGVPAVRKYYDPELNTFPHKRIAREALMAGNDVLFISQFGLSGSWEEQMQNLRETILYFRDLYNSDNDFRLRVDDAVKRILQAKLHLSPNLELSDVSVDAEAAASGVGRADSEMYQIIRESVTSIHPRASELKNRLPSPPQVDEDIVIFVDSRPISNCESLGVNSLQDAMIEWYGPEATGQIAPERIRSFSFEKLTGFIDGNIEPTEADYIEYTINEAEWIIFAMLDLNPDDYPASMAVKRFLADYAATILDKKVIGIAYNVPYNLDTTEISKLSAYFGVYGKTAPCIEASIRALFGDFLPAGASPVTISGLYDLPTQLEPDPTQAIEIFWDNPRDYVLVGESIRVHSSVIYDKNGHPVPDGTLILFNLRYTGEEPYPAQAALTSDGVVHATFLLERPGQVELGITRSQDAVEGNKVVVTVLQPTPTPTETPSPTGMPSPTPTSTPSATSTPLPTHTPTDTPTTTPTASPTATSTPSPTATATPTDTPLPTATSTPTATPEWVGILNRGDTDQNDFLLTLAGIATAGIFLYTLDARARRVPEAALRLILSCLVWGLLGYLGYAIGILRLNYILGDTLPPNLPWWWETATIGFVCGFVPILSILWRTVRQSTVNQPKQLDR